MREGDAQSNPPNNTSRLRSYMYVARGREITARKVTVNLRLEVTRDVLAKLGERAGQHEQRQPEGERECIMTDSMEQNCQRTHWATFYHENRELKDSISVQYAI